jgi:hypothetical protein
MTRRVRKPSTRSASSSLLVACAFVACSSSLSRSALADDTTLPETAPPPPSLAPDTPASTDAAPAAKSEPSADVFKAPEPPEPIATPAPEASEAASTEKKDEEKPSEAPAAVAAEPAPAPTENTEDARQESAIEAKKEGRVPYYQTTHPAWGFELSATIGALGGQDIEASQGGSLARGLEMQFEYQLPFLQAIGVLSFGPSFALYPIGADGSVTPDAKSIWAAGGQVRYQARFFREQIIVPMAGYEYQQFSYNFSDGNSGKTPLSGAFVGAMFLLNVVEPSAASELYINAEISRSYLVAEYKMLSASDANVDISGGSFYFGFRLEF